MALSSSVGYRLRDRSLEGKKQLVFEGVLGIEGLGFRESCKLNEKPNRRNKKQTNWKKQKNIKTTNNTIFLNSSNGPSNP